MRRLWIYHLLPLAFAVVPVLAGTAVFAAIPPDARRDYLARVAVSPIDWLIIALGLVLFSAQAVLCWKSLKWVGADFDTRPDKWLSHLCQAAEWFPLLGLIGTVAAILQTFNSIAPGTTPTPQEIIRKYAPAITATGSGLFMALMNILPVWVANLGRDLIRTLSGQPDPNGVVPLTPAPPADSKGVP